MINNTDMAQRLMASNAFSASMTAENKGAAATKFANLVTNNGEIEVDESTFQSLKADFDSLVRRHGSDVINQIVPGNVSLLERGAESLALVIREESAGDGASAAATSETQLTIPTAAEQSRMQAAMETMLTVGQFVAENFTPEKLKPIVENARSFAAWVGREDLANAVNSAAAMAENLGETARTVKETMEGKSPSDASAGAGTAGTKEEAAATDEISTPAAAISAAPEEELTAPTTPAPTPPPPPAAQTPPPAPAAQTPSPSPAAAGSARSDLLESIRAGKKLKSTEKDAAAGAGAAKSTDPLLGALSDALSQRRERLSDDSDANSDDESDSSSDWD
jgi:hypothetical protein